MSEEKNRRRWFQFSLGMLFVVVTVVGAWLGYELNWIKQRREFLTSDNVACTAEPYIAWGGGMPRQVEATNAPGILWLFGERGVGVIVVAPDGDKPTAEPVSRGRCLFPEAQVNSTISE